VTTLQTMRNSLTIPDISLTVRNTPPQHSAC